MRRWSSHERTHSHLSTHSSIFPPLPPAAMSRKTMSLKKRDTVVRKTNPRVWSGNSKSYMKQEKHIGARQWMKRLSSWQDSCRKKKGTACTTIRQHTSAYVEEEDSMHHQYQDTGGNPRVFAGTQGATGEEKMNKSAVAPRLLLAVTECGVYEFHMSNGSYISLDTFRSRSMDHTVFHKWLIKQTKESALCLGNAWTEVEERVFIEKLADFACRPEEDDLRKNFCTPPSSLPPLCPPPTLTHFYSPTCADDSSPSPSLRFSSAPWKRKCESF